MGPTPEVHATIHSRRTQMSRMYGHQPRSQGPGDHRSTPKHSHRAPKRGKGNQCTTKTSAKNIQAKLNKHVNKKDKTITRPFYFIYFGSTQSSPCFRHQRLVPLASGLYCEFSYGLPFPTAQSNASTQPGSAHSCGYPSPSYSGQSSPTTPRAPSRP